MTNHCFHKNMKHDTKVIMLKIQLCIAEINYILKYIEIENSYFELSKIFHNNTDLLCFWWNKRNLGEHDISIYLTCLKVYGLAQKRGKSTINKLCRRIK